ncbi:MAG: DUF5331 domain-containing protein [Leptolyngbyaceae cyanobacterium RU_5_1]|nr:DUF5331 domain-containing protein [Leptolyngbyaceae cyanobacterium RU_5_1]
MNIQQFRQSIRDKWLSFYIENRQWIIRLRIWVDCDGQRRPSSSFILATLSVLEPELNQLLPLIVDLSSNPDRIVAALGLNFNPDEHPDVIARIQTESLNSSQSEEVTSNGSVKMLPAALSELTPPSTRVASLLSKIDESCPGGRYSGKPEPERS